jgi:hypothetical protein
MDSKHLELAIWELGAHDKEGFARLRSSPGPYVFLICFPIDCTDTLAKINIRVCLIRIKLFKPELTILDL